MFVVSLAIFAAFAVSRLPGLQIRAGGGELNPGSGTFQGQFHAAGGELLGSAELGDFPARQGDFIRPHVFGTAFHLVRICGVKP